MTLETLFDEYIESLGESLEDEYYAPLEWIHKQGLDGFIDWLKEQPYEIIIKKK